MKLLKFPHVDPALSRIDSLRKFIDHDTSGEYVDEILLMLTEWAASIDSEDPSLIAFYAKLIEARSWLWEFYEIDAVDGHEKHN
jgi:hypothetical protein